MRKRQILVTAAAVTASLVVFGINNQARATSYASQLNVTGSAVSFDLNEAAADVTLVLDNNSRVDLGAQPGGMVNTTLTAGQTNDLNPSLVQVVVSTSDGDGFLAANSQGYNGSTALEIDPPFVVTGSHESMIFGTPRGIAVVTDPTNPSFGRIYVGNSATNTGTNLPQVGVYGLNPDFTFVGQYATEADAKTAGSTVTELGGPAGLTFGGGSSDPWRMSIGPDGYLYISSWHDATGGLLRAKVDATNGLSDGSNVFSQSGISSVNHSDILSAAVIHGSTATGDLTVTAIDPYFGGASYGTGTDANQIFRWDVGAVTGYAGAPTKLLDIEHQVTDPTGGLPYMPLDSRFWSPQNLYAVSQSSAHWYSDFGGVDFDLAQGGPNNNFYVTQSRSAGQQPDLFVTSPDGLTLLWDSLDATVRQGLVSSNKDFILGAYSESVSPDGRFLAVGKAGGVYVVPLLAGMPDLRLNMLMSAVPAGYTYRQPAFDAAGNIYSTATYSTTGPSVGAFGAGGNSVTVTGSNGTFAAGGQWTADANGSLSNTANWLVGNLPNGTDQTLTFGATTAQRTVSVDTNETAGAITFSSPKGYVLSSGGGSITLNGLGANLMATAGDTEIKAPVTVNTDLGLYAAAGASLKISGTITYGNVTDWTSNATPDIVKNGPGTVSVSNLNLVQSNIGDKSSGNLDIYAGKLALLPNSGPAVVSELSVFDGASLDLSNNDLIYDYNLDNYTTVSPLAVVQGLVASGNDHGHQDGSGIVTSASNGATGLAVAENSNFPGGQLSTFDGQQVTSSTVIVKYTWYGDVNMDGVVNSEDWTLMGSNPGGGWTGGDLNYDGVVNADDYALFALGSAASGGQNISSVPEPASMAVLALAALPMLRRRRRVVSN